MMTRRLAAAVLACAVSLLMPAAVRAEGVVILVRHAEKAADPNNTKDPGLSTEGQLRAQSLASHLKNAEITAIITSEFQRTIKTAEPLAAALKLTPVVLAADKLDDLVARVRELRKAGTVLVVGHSNTVPDIIKKLGVTTEVSIADAEYDNIFMVVGSAIDGSRPSGNASTPTAAPTLIRLRY